MKKAFLAVCLICAVAFVQCKSAHEPLTLKGTIVLDSVKGDFDQMAFDAQGQRLFLAAEENHTLEVVDVKNMCSMASLTGFDVPKWAVYRPELNKLYVSTAGDGKVIVLDGRSFAHINELRFKEKCNDMRFDAATNRLYVGVGATFGSIGIVNALTDEIIGEIALSGFPKQFKIFGNKLYINVPATNAVEVADLNVGKVVSSWNVLKDGDNDPMGIDTLNNRLFVGCGHGELAVFDMESGSKVATLAIAKDCDGIAYDATRRQLYVSCGEGFIDIIKQVSPDKYELAAKIPTREGAATSLFVPELNILILIAPEYEGKPAEVRVYNVN